MSVKIHITLDDDLAERLKALAKAEDRAFSRQVAFMLRKALDGMPFEPGQPPEGIDSAKVESEIERLNKLALDPPEPDTVDPWWQEQPGGRPSS